MLDYQNLKLQEAKRKKVLMLTLIISIFLHMLLFFVFNLEFVLFRKVKVSKVMRIRRIKVPFPEGKRPGPLSASSARKKAKPKPFKKKSKTPRKKKKPIKKITSKTKAVTHEKVDTPSKEEQELALLQEAQMHDVLSMVGEGEIVPGGGNLGEDDSAWGVEYEEGMEYDPYADDFEAVSNIDQNDYLGTTAIPIVKSEPLTSIGDKFTPIPYPSEKKIKQENIKASICRVYLRLYINEYGEIDVVKIRSPKSKADREKYKIFLDAVIDTVNEWDYDHQKAIVFVDVRFTIE